jgi:hypothetical protein
VVVGLLLAQGSAGGPAAQTLEPLLGANSIRYEERPPYCSGPPILLHYHAPGVRDEVRAQLAAMRAGGMRALRLFIYHATDVRDNGSLVSSAGGRLAEPYRTNLADYLDDVRAAGFHELERHLQPVVRERSDRLHADSLRPWKARRELGVHRRHPAARESARAVDD